MEAFVLNCIERYYKRLDEAAQQEKQQAAEAKARGEERAQSIHLMKASMLGDMLKALGRVVYEGKRPDALNNLVVSFGEEAEKARKSGDYDAADRAEQKAMTIQFAIDALEEAKAHGA